MQGQSAGQAEREELPCVPASVAAIRETLTRLRDGILDAHHFLCHPESTQRERSDDI